MKNMTSPLKTGSAAEVQSQLYIALDLKYLPQEDFTKAYALCQEINRQTTGLIKYLNDSSNSGS